MFLLARFLRSLATMLHSEISPNQIAGGAALGALIGFLPLFTLTSLFIILLILILRVNIAAAFLAAAVFGIISVLFDPLSDKLGYLLLVDIKALTPLWTWLYNAPLIPFTRFYNTLVMGSLAVGLMLFVPLFIAAARFVVYYRANLQQKVEAMHVVKLLKMTSIFQWYDKFK